jgi:hydroxymethylglutaryl-CoA reductase (NADPH)
MAAITDRRKRIPRDREHDYTHEAADRRAEFVKEHTGVSLEHVTSYSFDPGITTGNIEQSSALRRCRSDGPGPAGQRRARAR